MSDSNRTIIIESPKQKPFTTWNTKVPVPESNEVVIRNHAIAINPIDSAIQNLGIIAPKYPSPLGHDIAGEVYDVGSEVATLKRGDRVMALCDGTFSREVKYSGFQEYSACSVNCVTKIPDNWTFVQGSVVPLAAATASVGLFNKDSLNLNPPVGGSPKSLGKTLLVWGGASSVGSSAIQLAHAAGYTVAATASSHNFDVLRTLGADILVNYHDENAIEQLVQKLENHEFVGAYVAAGDDSGIENASKVVSLLNGVKWVSSAVVMSPNAKPAVHVEWVDIGYMNLTDEVRRCLKLVFTDYLPEALARGEYKKFPPAKVVGRGIEALQEATDINFKRRVAEKTVVEL